MKIGVLSDTHDQLTMIDTALALFRQHRVEMLLHPGDVVAPFAAKHMLAWTGPLKIIFGNNDGERKGLKVLLPQIQDGPLFVEAAGRKILLHHAYEWCTPHDITAADIVVTGHTHEIVNETRDRKLFLNPGECCGWVTGRGTVALLDTEHMTAEIIEVKP
ncbi:MAG TPA: metallophosphoesterase [Phycisphaerae bacterium]|nr:metallophosphoesterase [Phycisphaerae bacterium]